MRLFLNIGNDGRIVIPKVIRKELGMKKNSKVIANIENGVMHISTIEHSIAQAQSLVKQYCKTKGNIVGELLKMRKEDFIHEEEQYESRNQDSK